MGILNGQPLPSPPHAVAKCKGSQAIPMLSPRVTPALTAWNRCETWTEGSSCEWGVEGTLSRLPQDPNHTVLGPAAHAAPSLAGTP